MSAFVFMRIILQNWLLQMRDRQGKTHTHTHTNKLHVQRCNVHKNVLAINRLAIFLFNHMIYPSVIFFRKNSILRLALKREHSRPETNN